MTAHDPITGIGERGAFEGELLALSLEEEAARLAPDALEELRVLAAAIEEAQDRAYPLAACSAESCRVWLDLSVLHERLAALFPASTYAGAGPRVSAVISALAAEDPLRAWALIARYEGEALDAQSREDLARLGEEAMTIYTAIRQGGAVSFVTLAETL